MNILILVFQIHSPGKCGLKSVESCLITIGWRIDH